MRTRCDDHQPALRWELGNLIDTEAAAVRRFRSGDRPTKPRTVQAQIRFSSSEAMRWPFYKKKKKKKKLQASGAVRGYSM